MKNETNTEKIMFVIDHMSFDKPYFIKASNEHKATEKWTDLYNEYLDNPLSEMEIKDDLCVYELKYDEAD